MKIIAYLFEVSICTFAFLALYHLLLKGLTFFSLNRMYLLASLVVSLTIPLAKIDIQKQTPTQIAAQLKPTTIEQFKIQSQSPIVLPNQDQVSLAELVVYGYALVALIILVLNLSRLYQMYLYTQGDFNLLNGLKVCYSTTGLVNCSFFNYVFIDPTQLSPVEIDTLLKHEAVHAAKKHSADKLFLLLCKSLLWFNPAVYVYDAELENTHEFEVDAELTSSLDLKSYAGLLIKLATPTQRPALTHHFGTHPVKRRIKMLHQERSGRHTIYVYTLILPLLTGLIWLFSVNFIYASAQLKKHFTLVLDAGHGGNDAGATAGQYTEKELSLALVNKVRRLAISKGMEVKLTRDKDVNLLLKDRALVQGDLLLSLHVTADANPGKNGIQILSTRPGNNPKRSRQIDQVVTQLYQNLNKLQGIKTANLNNEVTGLYLLKNSIAPSVLLELGYISNSADLNFLTNPEQQDELAASILQSVLDYQSNLAESGR
jgi:N-acetylmuramoyl-L-alanine amidase